MNNEFDVNGFMSMIESNRQRKEPTEKEIKESQLITERINELMKSVSDFNKGTNNYNLDSKQKCFSRLRDMGDYIEHLFSDDYEFNRLSWADENNISLQAFTEILSHLLSVYDLDVADRDGCCNF